MGHSLSFARGPDHSTSRTATAALASVRAAMCSALSHIVAPCMHAAHCHTCAPPHPHRSPLDPPIASLRAQHCAHSQPTAPQGLTNPWRGGELRRDCRPLAQPAQPVAKTHACLPTPQIVDMMLTSIATCLLLATGIRTTHAGGAPPPYCAPAPSFPPVPSFPPAPPSRPPAPPPPLAPVIVCATDAECPEGFTCSLASRTARMLLFSSRPPTRGHCVPAAPGIDG